MRIAARAFTALRLLILAACVATPLTAGAAPFQPLGGFKHDRWPLERGAPGRINSIGQSADGYLWIGSVEGLFRFDGVRFVRVDRSDPAMSRLVVSQVKGSRNGDVWVGLARGGGVAVVRGGRLVDAGMPNPPREVNDIEEDADGGIWIASGGRSVDTLARFAAGRWREYGRESGLPAQPVWDMLFTRDGTQWVATNDRVVLRERGAARFRDAGIAVSPRASLAEDPQGRLWLSDVRGTRVFEQRDGGAGLRARLPYPDRVAGTRILFDRRGALWETTWNSGILRIEAAGDADGRAGARAAIRFFNAATGLTSDQARALFQDREGNVWVGTELGLDMLRPARVVVEQSIAADSPSSYRMAAAQDGVVYVADAASLYMIEPGRAPTRIRRLATPAEALCADRASGAWLIAGDRLLHVERTRVKSFSRPAGMVALGCAQDAAGRLWVPGLERGLFWYAEGRWRRWSGLNDSESLPANAAIDPDGRAVILFRGSLPGHGDLPFRPLSSERSRVGGIEGLLPTRSRILISGSGGLAAPFDPNLHPLTMSSYPWGASLNGLVQTARGDSWGIGDEGIVRLRSADLEAALRRPGRAVAHQRFDFRDGLNSFVQKAPGAQAVEGGDGRLWFLTRRNVMRIDPAAIPVNRRPPTVIVETLKVGDRLYAAGRELRLPAGTRRVELAYTATSLTVPDRVRFRYRLLGLDARWRDPGTRRRVVFSDLDPGRYIFQVIAANEDGVWNRRGRSTPFEIPRLFYQTLWFRLVVGVALLSALYLLYLARINYLRARIHDKLAERTLERERIARELHDTLIQAVQGLIMRFQSVADVLADDVRAQAVLIPALDRAEEVLIEGRDRVKGLRRLDERHLLAELGRIASGQAVEGAMRVSVTSKGIARPIAPEAVDDVLGIVSEAVSNAARHSRGSEIEVQLVFGIRNLALFVRDDGVGIPGDVMSAGGRSGHYGLLGMRERAARIGARLSVVSSNAGTLLELRVPGRIAYGRREAD